MKGNNMLNAKLILTDEFKAKLNKKLSYPELGKLRQARLKELEEKGYLQEINTRNDLGLACGFSENQTSRINSWVTYLIQHKKLTETLIGFKDNKAQYEYHYIGDKIVKVAEKVEPAVETPEKVEISPSEAYEFELWLPNDKMLHVKLKTFDEVKNLINDFKA